MSHSILLPMIGSTFDQTTRQIALKPELVKKCGENRDGEVSATNVH